MLEYEVSVDFHDHTVTAPKKTFTSLLELALYLERIPSMFGFEFGSTTTSINIETRVINPKIEQLTLETPC